MDTEPQQVISQPIITEKQPGRQGFGGMGYMVATDPATNDRIEGNIGEGYLTFFLNGEGEGILYETCDLLPDMDNSWLYTQHATMFMRACQYEHRIARAA